MTDGRATRLGAAGQSTLAEAIGRWEMTLDAATADAVAEQVRIFLEDLAAKGPAEAAKGKSPQAADAIMAFALYCLNDLPARPSASSSPPPARADPPPATAADTAEATGRTRRSPAETMALIQRLWRERIRLVAEAPFADLLRLFVRASTKGRKQQAWTLQSLLRVYFEMDWSAAGDLLQELAYKAGGLICGLIMDQTDLDQNMLMQAGCELLNRNQQVAQQFECRALPAHSGYDVNTCEAPQGQRRPGQSVIPLSFYIVRRQNGQVCRRAQVNWA
ncbi:MAG: hypothetical protein ACYS5V_13850 [Planctomycetota bacterium]|jgi:hypothetical protein